MHKKVHLGFFFFFFHHPNSKFTNFQVLGNYMHFPPTSPTSLMCMVLNCQALLKYGQFELAPTAAHNEGWMVSDSETVFCWVPVPLLTMMVSSVAFFSPTAYLLTTHKQVVSMLVLCIAVHFFFSISSFVCLMVLLLWS
jgi:hypothetical protein